ncbi:MAG: hypothetical protein U5N86_05030 [Planctomycetota bacterium]|nr:hypothetical protein [Planctomycetota bacterium]
MKDPAMIMGIVASALGLVNLILIVIVLVTNKQARAWSIKVLKKDIDTRFKKLNTSIAEETEKTRKQVIQENDDLFSDFSERTGEAMLNVQTSVDRSLRTAESELKACINNSEEKILSKAQASIDETKSAQSKIIKEFRKPIDEALR